MGKKRANVLQNSVFKSVSSNYTINSSKFNRYSLYKFDHKTGLIVSSSDINEIKNRFMPSNGLVYYGGGTAMKDGLIKVISDLKHDTRSDNKVVVMFTDGDSNSDVMSQKMSSVISDALKTPRLLEASPDSPVHFPVGKDAFDAYHQNHFEKFFANLNKS